MASLAETIRDRWEGISERERRLVFLLGGAVVITVVWLLVASIRDGLTTIDDRNAKMRKALKTLANLRESGGQNKPVDDPTKNIGTEAVSLPTYLAHAAESQKLQPPSFNPRTPVTKDGFTTSSGTIEMRDLTIQQAKDYLEAIETGNRLVAITSLTINRNFRDKEKLDLRLEVATYARVPEAPPAGAGSGSGSGSDAGSGSAGGS